MALRMYKNNRSDRNDRSDRRNNREESFEQINKIPENPLTPYTLETLPSKLKAAYERGGWETVMPVQAHAMPYLVEGRDMMIQSRTGSGKTGAYLLPLLERVNENLARTQALILVPTRELAVQVEREAQNLFGNTLRVVTLYGGVPYNKQLDALRRGTHIVVGTPGRVLDHLQKGTLNLESLQALIFDEADRMLSIGFYPDMKAIYDYLPEGDMLVTLFSATYPHYVLELAKQFMKEPQLLSLSGGQVHIAESAHYCVSCKPMEKDRVLIRLLETENPDSSIIFCNTKATVHYVAQVLQGFGYNAEELSSELSQSKREYVLNRLRKGQTRFLVATDVAARGIDIPMLSHVFLYEPPEDRESYIHRAGRTGRAGAAGTVISLIDTMERLDLQRIAQFYNIDLIALDSPSAEIVEKAVGMRLTAYLEQQKRTLTGLQRERIERYTQLAQQLACAQSEEKDEETIFLLAMLLDEKYQQILSPTPAENFEQKRRGSRQGYRTEKTVPAEEVPLTSDDTLDSMRAAFQKEKQDKERMRRGRRNPHSSQTPQRPRKYENEGRRPQENRPRSEETSSYASSHVRISFEKEGSEVSPYAGERKGQRGAGRGERNSNFENFERPQSGSSEDSSYRKDRKSGFESRNRSENSGGYGRNERGEYSDRRDRADSPERGERQERGDRPERSDRFERKDFKSRDERKPFDRSDRNSRDERKPFEDKRGRNENRDRVESRPSFGNATRGERKEYRSSSDSYGRGDSRPTFNPRNNFEPKDFSQKDGEKRGFGGDRDFSVQNPSSPFKRVKKTKNDADDFSFSGKKKKKRTFRP